MAARTRPNASPKIYHSPAHRPWSLEGHGHGHILAVEHITKENKQPIPTLFHPASWHPEQTRRGLWYHRPEAPLTTSAGGGKSLDELFIFLCDMLLK
jgi:hypothetical protein